MDRAIGGPRPPETVAAQMNAGFFERQRHIEAVINHELAAARACELLNLHRQGQAAPSRRDRVHALNGGRPAFNACARTRPTAWPFVC